jgi:uncharacterized protein
MSRPPARRRKGDVGLAVVTEVRHARAALLAVFLLQLAACGAAAPRGADHPGGYAFGKCRMGVNRSYGTQPIRSLYVTMRDGVRIAIDVILPEGLAESARVPTVLTATRYWRAVEGEDGPSPIQRFFTSHGYAVVWGDARGTGASFGTWPHQRSRDETLDYGELIDWITQQPWSDGTVAAWGRSYTANTADWMVERNRPALKAVVSRFPDYDPYADLYFPGGVPNVYMGRTWGLEVKQMDLNMPILHDGKWHRGVRPVGGDDGKALLQEAIEQRRHLPDVWQALQSISFKDDRPKTWGGWSMQDWGIHAWRAAVERAGTAIDSWGSWMDAGTANGVLHRFMTLRNPQRAVIGPWSHGAEHHASPYAPPNAPTDPPADVQRLEDLCFLEQWVVGRDAGRGDRLLVYYTMGEERWKTTREWPISGARITPWYFAADGRLTENSPTIERGEDEYAVNFQATTGMNNRWATNNTGGDVTYPDRAAADRRLLTYTSEPLVEDIEITGQPVVTLWVTSTHEDGAFFVYLEDVTRSGEVLYLTEGMLRAVHRRVANDPPYRVLGPYHSFKRADALPLVPGEIAELTFELMPTSVLIHAGHRIRIAIAGADADTFRRIPDTGDPVIVVARNRVHASHIKLPIVPRQAGR